MKKIIAAISLMILMMVSMSGCAWIERLGKDIKSDAAGGLPRTVTVYTANGDVLKTYKGKIDLESTESGIVKFDLNGQRVMYYNCYVEVLEEVEE